MSDSNLPEGWAKVPIRDTAYYLRGVSYKKQDAQKIFSEGYLPILRATNIQHNKLILDHNLVYVPKEYVKNDQMLEQGDVVICMSSGSKHLVGKAAFLTTDWEGSFGTFCGAVRFLNPVNNKFGGYFFESPEYRRMVRASSSGININNLRRGDIENLDIVIPPLPEQKRIVAKIEELFTQLDAGVAALKRAQANLKRYKASVLKAACEGRLVPTEAELHPDGYEPASVLLERILKERREKWETDLIDEGTDPSKCKYKEPTQPDVEKLPELPEGWCWASFDSLLIDGLSNGLYKSAKYISDDGIRIIDIKGLYKGFFADFNNCRRFDLTNDEINRYSLQEGDILINRVSKVHEGVGKPALVETLSEITVYESNMMRAEVSSFLNTRYLIYILHSSFVRNQLINKSKRTQQSSVNQVDVKSIIVPIPPKDEQERIVRRTEKLYSLIQQQEKQVVISIKRADRLRQSILKRAFEGRLVPQDPNDEPASVLLERIQESKII